MPGKPKKQRPKKAARDVALTGIYRQKNPRQEIWTIYFYYVKDDGSADGIVTAYPYYHHENILDIRHEIDRLIDNHLGELDNPPPAADQFRTYKWRKKSFIVIVLESARWKFVEDNAIRVKQHGGNYVNHCFFDGDDYSKTVPVGGGAPLELSIVYFINHMTDRNDINLGDGIYDRFDFEWGLTKGRKGPVKILVPPDSGGTNMGPPAPPPF